MGFPLRPQETVVFPSPYEENAANPLLITNFRVIQITQHGPYEVETKNLNAIVRGHDQRPFLIGLLLMLLALPMLGFGAHGYFSTGSTLSKPVPKCKPKCKTKKEALDKAAYEEAKDVRFRSYILLGLGALAAWGGWKLFKRRHTVVCGGGGRVMTIKVKTKAQQSQVFMTLQSMQQSARATAGAVAAAQAPPPRRR